MTTTDSTAYVFRSPADRLARIETKDGVSAYAGFPAVTLDGQVNTAQAGDFSTSKPFFFYTINPDQTQTGGALPNGDVPYGTDSYVSYVADQCYVISKNRLRNDAPAASAVLNGSGALIGVTIGTATGYTPNSTVACTVGAGQLLGTGHVGFSATTNASGTITGFTHNGQPLSATNPIPGPWPAGVHIRVAPPNVPAGETRVKFDFGPGVAFVRDTAPYSLATGSAFATFTFAHSIATRQPNGDISGTISQSGTAIIMRVTDDNPETIRNQFEFYTADPQGTSRAGNGLVNPLNIGRGVYGTGGQDRGTGVLDFQRIFMNGRELPDFRKDTTGSYTLRVRNATSAANTEAAVSVGNDLSADAIKLFALSSGSTWAGTTGAMGLLGIIQKALIFGTNSIETFRLSADGLRLAMKGVLNLGGPSPAPADGDLWHEGTSLKIRLGGVTRTVNLT